MKIALCQISSRLGDFTNNRKKIQALADQYQNCDLLIFPEMTLMGYPPEDTLELKFLIQKQLREIKKLKLTKKQPALLFGAVTLKNHKLFNSAVFIHGHTIKYFHKSYLAVTDTFDEMRFFSQGEEGSSTLSFKNKKFLILICEDLWHIQSFPKNIDGVFSLNASPFYPEQMQNRLKAAQNISKKTKAPFIYVNTVGGQDSWIFDGSSFILNPLGKPILSASSFKEQICVIDWTPLKVLNSTVLENIKNRHKEKALNKKSMNLKTKKIHPTQYKLLQTNSLSQKKEAILLGLKDFICHNNFKKIHLGLSGGLDSALTLQLCCEVFEKKNITAFFLEGPFTYKISQQLSQNLAKELGVCWVSQPIHSTYQHILSLFKTSNLARENIQARIRGLFLMAYSNEAPSLLIGTSNKSELAAGYSTLYGDLTGALLPIGDLYKTEVQKMVQTFYSKSLIMKKILKRAPSAELSKNQTDQDDLPPYSKLDSILKNIIENNKEPKTALEKQMFLKIIQTEFKRRQSPIVLKVSKKAFGRGRRYPISISF